MALPWDESLIDMTEGRKNDIVEQLIDGNAGLVSTHQKRANRAGLARFQKPSRLVAERGNVAWVLLHAEDFHSPNV
jgi:hypothetical protein